MKPRFEIGDKVIEKEPCFGGYGYVTSINHYNDPDCYVVKFANGDERVSYIEDFCVEDSDIKAAFLTRLQELLATFDAEIGVHSSSNIEGMPGGVMLTIYGVYPEIRMFYNMPLVKSDDVFDYDKD